MNTNLLDLNDDVLNIIGRYVKKHNFEKEIMKEKQILNGKEIIFGLYPFWALYDIKLSDPFSQFIFKNYLFNRIDNDIKKIKVHARDNKIKLTNTDIRLCIWVLFQRYKLILLKDYKVNFNMECLYHYLYHYFSLNKLNLKNKKYLFNY
jgi:hypothetical protein